MATVTSMLAILLTLNGFVAVTGITEIATGADDYYGIRLGQIIMPRYSTKNSLIFVAETLRGTLYCVDESTIFVSKFTLEEWNGNSDIYFYAVKLRPNTTLGENVQFAKQIALTVVTGSNTPLQISGYGGENLLLRFPHKRYKITDFDGIVVLYFTYFEKLPFSDLIDIPRDLIPPRPCTLGEFQIFHETRIHAVHADAAVALNTHEIALYNFNYDGYSPSATFWVGSGQRVDPTGIKIAGPDADSQGWVPRYRNANITITFPSNITVFDIDYLALWNELFVLDLGHVFFNLTGKIVPPYFNNATFVPVPPFYPVNEKPLFNTFRFAEDYGVDADGLILLNTKQILIEEFSYNGGCSEAYFWVGYNGNEADDGIPYVDVLEENYYRVERLPSPNGDRNAPLLRYYKTNITLTIQGDFTFNDLGFFALYCDSLATPKRVAYAFLPDKRREKYDGRLPEYSGGDEPDVNAEADMERERVSNYIRKIWRNIFTCLLIFCQN